jgi:hypothetical protein
MFFEPEQAWRFVLDQHDAEHQRMGGIAWDARCLLGQPLRPLDARGPAKISAFFRCTAMFSKVRLFSRS